MRIYWAFLIGLNYLVWVWLVELYHELLDDTWDDNDMAQREEHGKRAQAAARGRAGVGGVHPVL